MSDRTSQMDTHSRKTHKTDSLLYLHIGFPKTASTTLQRAIFRNDPAICYLGKSSLNKKTDAVCTKFLESLLWSSSRFWETHGQATAAELIAAADIINPSSGSKPVVISAEEILASTFPSLQVAMRFHQGRLVGLDPDVLIERLRVFALHGWTAGKIRILLTIRRQDHFLASYFAQTFLWLHKYGLNTLEAFAEKVTDTNYYSMGGLTLNYSELIDRLEEALGPGSVDVILYEDLQKNPQEALKIISGSTGINMDSAIKALKATSFKLRKSEENSWKVNRYQGKGLLKHALQHLSRTLKRQENPRLVTLTDSLSMAIMERYHQSNQRMAERLGRDLRSLGYIS
ncbi:MAG: hypothetical protein WED00_01195 [Aquisalimonadaceae bacterium]